MAAAFSASLARWSGVPCVPASPREQTMKWAGRPRCVLPLLGMGLTRFSMSPAFVPSIKEMVRRTSMEAAREVAERVLTMTTIGEIRGYLTRTVRQLWPNVTMLDVNK